MLVIRQILEDHTESFRGSAERQEWRRLLLHFYGSFTEEGHYTPPSEQRR